jgi:hypothetical protein
MISFRILGIQSFNGDIYEYRLNNFLFCFVEGLMTTQNSHHVQLVIL